MGNIAQKMILSSDCGVDEIGKICIKSQKIVLRVRFFWSMVFLLY